MSYGMMWALAQDKKRKKINKDIHKKQEGLTKPKKVCSDCGGENLTVGCTGTQMATACNDCMKLVYPVKK
jgi:hypothetical protein